jgi:hypothetical protein
MDPNTPGADAPLHPAQEAPTDDAARLEAARAREMERQAAQAAGVDAGVPVAVTKAQQDETLTDEEEWGALEYLLGATRSLHYSLPVQYDTPKGRQEITLEIKQLDPTRLEELDRENRAGDNALAALNRFAFNSAVCADGVVAITDKTGARVETTSVRWLGGAPTPAAAMRGRFRFQGGIIDMVSDQIQAISGYSADRVGTAQRMLVEAGKG